MYVITIIGGLFYVSQFPEKMFPGVCRVSCEPGKVKGQRASSNKFCHGNTTCHSVNTIIISHFKTRCQLLVDLCALVLANAPTALP